MKDINYKGNLEKNIKDTKTSTKGLILRNLVHGLFAVLMGLCMALIYLMIFYPAILELPIESLSSKFLLSMDLTLGGSVLISTTIFALTEKILANRTIKKSKRNLGELAIEIINEGQIVSVKDLQNSIIKKDVEISPKDSTLKVNETKDFYITNQKKELIVLRELLKQKKEEKSQGFKLLEPEEVKRLVSPIYK